MKNSPEVTGPVAIIGGKAHLTPAQVEELTARRFNMKTKHTPGKWKVRNGVNEAFIDAPHIVCLAVVNSLDSTRKEVAQCKANARLIASAPELLAALVDICEAYGCECIDPKHPNHCPMCLGRAAIAQATGGAK